MQIQFAPDEGAAVLVPNRCSSWRCAGVPNNLFPCPKAISKRRSDCARKRLFYLTINLYRFTVPYRRLADTFCCPVATNWLRNSVFEQIVFYLHLVLRGIWTLRSSFFDRSLLNLLATVVLAILNIVGIFLFTISVIGAGLTILLRMQMWLLIWIASRFSLKRWW